MKRIYSEKFVEELIKNFPLDFTGEDLTFAHQQRRLKGYPPDLIFKDENGRFVIVEVQINALDRAHFYRAIEYRDFLVEEDGCDIPRVILFCNTLPPRFKPHLKTHNVELIAMLKEEILLKAKKFYPKLQFVEKRSIIKDRRGITVGKLLDILQKKRETPVQLVEDDIAIFWFKTWKNRYEENDILSSKVRRFEITDAEREKPNYLRMKLNPPFELYVSSSPFAECNKNNIEALSLWLQFIKRNLNYQDKDVDVVFRRNYGMEELHHVTEKGLHSVHEDPLQFSSYIQGTVKLYESLRNTYGTWSSKFDNGYNFDVEKLTTDLTLLSKIKFYDGKYPNLIPVNIFERFSIIEGPGKLEKKLFISVEDMFADKTESERIDIYNRYLELHSNRFQTVRLFNVNEKWLKVSRMLLDHFEISHCQSFNGVFSFNSYGCRPCVQPPMLVKNIWPTALRVSAKYFRHSEDFDSLHICEYRDEY